MASHDNLTAGLGDLYRQQRKKKRPAPVVRNVSRTRTGRTMALDPFYVLTLVLLFCALLLQLGLIVWLDFV